MLYPTIKEKAGKSKMLAVLIDPENIGESFLDRFLASLSDVPFDFFLVGGSLVTTPLDSFVLALKARDSRPVVLFPGSVFQLTREVDAVLFLSLISGRNPEYLIGQHVVSAPFLKQSGKEVIPTGYILINDQSVSATAYISNTLPIPMDKPDLVTATALAGELLGLKLLYLEAGSGSGLCVPPDIVSAVRQKCTLPIMVGGGIRSLAQLDSLYAAGADIAVIGNAFEKESRLIHELKGYRYL